jgi:hypothetical protein
VLGAERPVTEVLSTAEPPAGIVYYTINADKNLIFVNWSSLSTPEKPLVSSLLGRGRFLGVL